MQCGSTRWVALEDNQHITERQQSKFAFANATIKVDHTKI